MSTDLQTPSHSRPPTGRGPVSPRVAAGVAAVLIAATTTGVLIGTAASRPAQEPTAGAGSPSAPQSVSAPAPADPPPVTAPPTGPTDTGTGPAPADEDVDGDGRRDVVSLPTDGTLRIRYATGLTDTVAFDAMAGEGRLLGIADADNDGRGEVFVHVGAGSYTDQTSVFRYVDGRLRLVTLDGKQLWLVSGASVRHSTSWACRPHTPIVVWSGESNDGTVYHGTLNSYRFSGATLTRISSPPLTTDDLKPPPRHCGQIRT